MGLVHERRSGSKDAPAPPSPNPLRCAGAMQSSSDTVLQRGAQREKELQFYFLSLTHISHLFYSMHNLLVPEHMDITDRPVPEVHTPNFTDGGFGSKRSERVYPVFGAAPRQKRDDWF